MNECVISGWFYPGYPCNYRAADIANYPGLNQICAEFLRIVRGGEIEVVLPEKFGNGAYSSDVLAELRQIPGVYCTLSGRTDTGVLDLLKSEQAIVSAVETISEFCRENRMGLDINIEGVAILSASECDDLVSLLKRLTLAVHATGQKVRIVTVAEGALYHGLWRNVLLRDIPCDYVVYMIYDYMYDWGRTGITTKEYIVSSIAKSKSDLGETWTDRFICGLPNYGYMGHQENIWAKRLLTKGQVSELGYLPLSQYSRDVDSHALTWEDATPRNIGGTILPCFYFCTDSVALDWYAEIAINLGCRKFCVWHLFGDNEWFSDTMVSKLTTAPTSLELRVSAIEQVLSRIKSAFVASQ